MNTQNNRLNNPKTQKKDYPVTLSVLNLPPKSWLLGMRSPSDDYNLSYHTKNKTNMAIFNVNIPKTKLFGNLEIYEWRKQTQFPIIKVWFVSVKKQTNLTDEKVQLDVFAQHCPLKLNRIYEMSISQGFYLVKECLIGFERLYSKFGGFQVTEPMISINEKGFCRVWGNQSYALNGFKKNNHTQTQMVNKIINIIQTHCVQSKLNKKLFQSLKQCNNFLEALKMVDSLILREKIFLPNRFSFPSPSKEKNKDHYTQILQFCKSIDLLKNQRPRSPSLRKKPREKGLSETPDLKRIKSTDKVFKVFDMKISGDETVCSTNNKDIRSQKSFRNILQPRDSCQSEHSKMIDDSIVIRSFPQKKFIEKKQLSYSEAQTKEPLKYKQLKYSEQIPQIKPQIMIQTGKKTKQEEPVINLSINQSKDIETNTPNTIFEEDEDKVHDHSFRIIKENGWKQKFTDLFQTPRALKQSIQFKRVGEIHQKEEVKLEKLGTLVKKNMTSSIHSQNPQEII